MPELEVGTAQAEISIIRLVQLWVSATGKKVTLVFDGHRSQERQASGLHLVYPSSQDRDADDTLRRLMLQDKQKTNSTLISNDGELVRFARAHGLKQVRSQEFARLLRETEQDVTNERSERKPAAPSDREVEAWIKYFSSRPGGNRSKK